MRSPEREPTDVIGADASFGVAKPSRPLRIRDVVVDPNLILAPMSGVTNSCFRRFILELNPRAVGLVVTEFISIEGLTRENEQSLRMMRFDPEERPIAIQIFGHEIWRMADAARMVEDTGANIVDINSGCPVPKVVKRGGGCELMRQPEHMARMLREVRRAVRIPLTLKIRAGWDSANRNALEIARIAESEGVELLTVHGRTRQEGYRGVADWRLIGEIAEALRIPVLGSGDVVDGPSAVERLSSGVAGLMIGRAALRNPWVFTEVREHLAGRAYVRPPAIETVRALERFIDILLVDMPERAAIGRLKQLASQITRRVRGAAEVRRTLCSTSSIETFRQELARWGEELRVDDRELVVGAFDDGDPREPAGLSGNDAAMGAVRIGETAHALSLSGGR